jgi:hypothetical protein
MSLYELTPLGRDKYAGTKVTSYGRLKEFPEGFEAVTEQGESCNYYFLGKVVKVSAVKYKIQRGKGIMNGAVALSAQLPFYAQNTKTRLRKAWFLL